MQVFPEQLKPIDPHDLPKAVRTLDENMRYMAERIDYAINLLEKKMNERS